MADAALKVIPNDGGPRHAHRFQKGNKAAAIKRAPEFRSKCRVVAEEAVNQLAVAVARGQVGTRGLIEIVKVLAPLGGYVAGQQLATAEANRWRVILTLLESKAVDPATRDEIMKVLMQRNDDTLGEPDTTENK